MFNVWAFAFRPLKEKSSTALNCVSVDQDINRSAVYAHTSVIRKCFPYRHEPCILTSMKRSLMEKEKSEGKWKKHFYWRFAERNESKQVIHISSFFLPRSSTQTKNNIYFISTLSHDVCKTESFYDAKLSSFYFQISHRGGIVKIDIRKKLSNNVRLRSCWKLVRRFLSRCRFHFELKLLHLKSVMGEPTFLAGPSPYQNLKIA